MDNVIPLTRKEKDKFSPYTDEELEALEEDTTEYIVARVLEAAHMSASFDGGQTTVPGVVCNIIENVIHHLIVELRNEGMNADEEI